MSTPLKDQAGRRIGLLVALRRVGMTRHGQAVWLFRCRCGGTRQGVPARLAALDAAGKGGPIACLDCLSRRRTRPAPDLHGRQGAFDIRERADAAEGVEAYRCWCRCCRRTQVILAAWLLWGMKCCPACLDRTDLAGLRYRRGIGIREAARMVGVSAQRWSQWERQEREGTLSAGCLGRARAALARRAAEPEGGGQHERANILQGHLLPARH